MKNIALLTGAYKNAGDYLIAERAKKLILSADQNVDCKCFLRSQILEHLEEINACDAVGFSGGPIYLPDINKYLHISDIADLLTSKVFIIGGGWSGMGGATSLPYKYKFEKKTYDFLRKIDSNGYGLSCRDIHSLKVLKNQGFRNVILTGCPAWYDLNYINRRKAPSGDIHSIAISDPALSGNYQAALEIVQYLTTNFPTVPITVVYHRGIKKNNTIFDNKIEKFYNYVIEHNGTIVNISDGSDGFKIYDKHDLHIGFRVHAHIYNLSIGHKSILIEEDGRGAGVNETLGLPSIRTYSDTFQATNRQLNKCLQLTGTCKNRFLIKEIDAYLDYLCQTNYVFFDNAFHIMDTCYVQMKSYIDRVLRECCS